MVDQMNRWIHFVQGFIGSFVQQWSELSRITDPDPDHLKGMHPKGANKVRFYYSLLWESCGKQAFSQSLKTGYTEGMFSHKIIRD